MCTKIQVSHAKKPLKWSFQMSATAWPRPITASWPLSQYRKARRGRWARSPWITPAVYSPIWMATGQMPGSNAAVLGERRGVAEHEHFGMSGNGAIRLHDGAPHAVQRCTQCPEQRARHVAGGPDHCPGGDSPPRGDHLTRTEVGHQRLGANLDAELPQLGLGRVAQRGRIRGKQTRSALEQQHGRLAASMCRKSRRRAYRRISATAPAISTPVGPPPTMTNVRKACRRTGSVSRSACSNARSTRRRISNASSKALEPGGDRLPLVVPEVGMPRAGRDDQIVVREAVPIGEVHLPGRRRRSRSPRPAALPCSSASEGSTGWGQAMSRGVERRGRDLVQHRLEQVVVPSVHDGDPHRRILRRRAA